MGDEEFLREMPGKLGVDKALVVGLRSMEPKAKERQPEIGLKSLSPEEYRANPTSVSEFVKGTGARKVMVHLDLDVLEPTELVCAVGRDADGMRIAEVAGLINTLAAEFDMVGLTIAEHMPIVELKLRSMLSQLPTF
ncbi:putative arginase family protein [Blattamonas nauphoetae]|uniref:Arginase family protein n=1 Tax=Blattamonas nauphoetae TaxID=2049346 RepID=A0ABQ9WYQ4_9EUKA|nr:putative arginase family protein [Blattamonas nauphoetae]